MMTTITDRELLQWATDRMNVNTNFDLRSTLPNPSVEHSSLTRNAIDDLQQLISAIISLKEAAQKLAESLSQAPLAAGLTQESLLEHYELAENAKEKDNLLAEKMMSVFSRHDFLDAMRAGMACDVFSISFRRNDNFVNVAITIRGCDLCITRQLIGENSPCDLLWPSTTFR